MAPAGGRHGECEANLVAALRQHTRGLGRVYTGDTGFLLRERPDELVSPDVAFVRTDRLPPPPERIGCLRVVPDLVAEIAERHGCRRAGEGGPVCQRWRCTHVRTQIRGAGCGDSFRWTFKRSSAACVFVSATVGYHQQ